MLKQIAAVARDGGIGRDGALLFHIPEDLSRFRRLTMGGSVVMGRATLDSLPGGRPLKGRRNLVLTRNPSFQRDGVEVVHSVWALLERLGSEDAWVVGGAEVYAVLLPLSEQLWLTEVDAAPPADRFFPALGAEWTLAQASDWRERSGLRWRYVRYERAARELWEETKTKDRIIFE